MNSVQSMDTRPYSETQKKCGRSALYFLLLGVRFSRQSSGLVDLKNSTTNVVSFTKRKPAKRQNTKNM